MGCEVVLDIVNYEKIPPEPDKKLRDQRGEVAYQQALREHDNAKRINETRKAFFLAVRWFLIKQTHLVEIKADFAGNPVDRPDGLVPGRHYVRLSEVVRSIGRRWTELERVKLTALAPIYTTKNALVREARIGAIDVGRLEKAARQVAKGMESDPDPVVEHYMRAIIDEESPW